MTENQQSINVKEHIPVADRLYVIKGASEENVLGDLRDLRSRFVVTMGWFDNGHQDGDRYDQIEETYHLAVRDEELDKIVAGLRLTQVDKVEKSLSWSMLARHDEMVAQAKSHSGADGELTIDKLDRFAHDGNVWDLTRLVNPLDGSVRPSKMVGAIIQLFAAGAALTAQRQEKVETLEEMRWIFVTTPSLKAFLDKEGIESEMIAQGRISAEDHEDSYFCMVEPIQATRFLYAHQNEYEFTVKHLTKGFEYVSAMDLA